MRGSSTTAWRNTPAIISPSAPKLSERSALNLHELVGSRDREIEHLIRRLAIEPLGALGRSLDLDEFSAGGVGDVHIDLGARVVGVVEVEADFAVDHAD